MNNWLEMSAGSIVTTNVELILRTFTQNNSYRDLQDITVHSPLSYSTQHC